VTLETVSPHLQNAVIACEDKRFYSHPGIDVFAVGRALGVNLREGRFAQGGSTITQQVAKNFFLSPRKTVARKLNEAELALALELRYSKKQILEMYLNKIYLGQTGVERIYGRRGRSGRLFLQTRGRSDAARGGRFWPASSRRRIAISCFATQTQPGPAATASWAG
jgi:membrane carboxypeptidase/penicillin-binding protein PbpC